MWKFKGQANLTLILAIGVFAIFISVAIAVANIISGSAELNKQVDLVLFLERSKSITGTLNNLESGEVTETLVAPATIRLFSDKNGQFIEAGGRQEKIRANVKNIQITSDKIRFLKNRGEPIEVMEAR